MGIYGRGMDLSPPFYSFPSFVDNVTSFSSPPTPLFQWFEGKKKGYRTFLFFLKGAREEGHSPFYFLFCLQVVGREWHGRWRESHSVQKCFSSLSNIPPLLFITVGVLVSACLGCWGSSDGSWD